MVKKQYPIVYLDEALALDGFETRLKECIRLHLLSDVPLGAGL